MRSIDRHEHIRNLTAYLLAIWCLIAFGSREVAAAPGDLDPTFGNGGKVVTTGIGGISDIAIQPDGKIVAVGGARIVRYNADGSLDSSFGGSGIIIIQLGNGISVFANSVAFQADGKIVVAAESLKDMTSVWGTALVRYNPNGTLDTTFDGTGIIVGGGGDSVAIQTDGKIVVCGGDSTGFVQRFNSIGTPDTTFNGTGIVTRPGSTFSALAIQTDGKIIVAGSASCCGPDTFYATIFRYNADGSSADPSSYSDRAFGFLDGVWSDHAYQLAIHPSGGIVTKIAGMENTDFCHTCPFSAVARGTSSFAYESNYLHAGDLAIQPDGKIVSVNTSYNLSDFAVRRYNSNLSLDPTFNGGLVTTDFGSEDEPSAVAIQPDGKIVAAGVSLTSGTTHDFALARYQGGQSPRARFDFDGDGRADASVFRPSDSVWYLNRSGAGFTAVQFGLPTDKIVPADYDGNSRTDIAVFRDGTWWRINSGDSTVEARQFGQAGDIPLPNDYNGDGRDELAVYRDGQWWFEPTGQMISFGLAADRPVPADYDGDGKTDVAIYRDGTWWKINSGTGSVEAVQFGLAADIPVPADYDGDGRADLAVYRDGTWYILQSTNGFTAFQWGISTDTPVPADYDGDGKTDAAICRDGQWWVLKSTGGVSVQHFGLAGDRPIPAANVQ